MSIYGYSYSTVIWNTSLDTSGLIGELNVLQFVQKTVLVSFQLDNTSCENFKHTASLYMLCP